MRTYGVLPGAGGGRQWVEVKTADNGDNSLVYLTTLCQVLQLNRGESPFYADYGIPALKSIQTQIPPDLYVAQTQAQFAPFFASLTVARSSGTDGAPIYTITAVTFQGAVLTLPDVPGYIAVPGGGFLGNPGDDFVGVPTGPAPVIPT